MAHENLVVDLTGWDIVIDDNGTRHLWSPFVSGTKITIGDDRSRLQHLYETGQFGPEVSGYPLNRGGSGIKLANDIFAAIQHKKNREAGIPDPPEPAPEPAPEEEYTAEELAPVETEETPPPAGDDLDQDNGANIERESEENMQSDEAADGLDTADTNPDASPDVTTPTETATDASNVLEDPFYGRVLRGWNQKLRASSKDISGLVPFCELYAIFDAEDLIANDDGTRYTGLRNRLIPITFVGSGGMPPPLPDGLSINCHVAKVAGENKSQIQQDSAIQIDDSTYEGYASFKGIPGINDLAISRGSAAAQNVKYDLTITLPNPEIINEQFEYSKLMLMNSPFLLIYGWNTKDSNFDELYPPDVNAGASVPVGNGMGGFWSSSVISLSNFQFNFDNVGHLVGKLTFLNPPGIFLGTMQTSSVGETISRELTEPSEAVKASVNNNQNFIWQNGIPWAPPVDDEESLMDITSSQHRNAVLQDFFESDTSGWTIHTERIFAEENFNVEEATVLRDNINSLEALGEQFLLGFRKTLVSDLYFNQEQGIEITMNERDHFNQLEEMGMTKSFEDDGEAAKIVDSIPAYNRLVNQAWNLFFNTRFQGLEAFDGTVIQQNAYNGGTNWPIGTIDKNRPSRVVAGEGNTYEEFEKYIDLGREDGRGRLMFVERPGARGVVVPMVFESEMSTPSYRPQVNPDSYIKQMPPFGQALQNDIFAYFSDPKNPNHNLLYADEARNLTPTIVKNVRDLIAMTSVLSIPVPVPQDQADAMQVETRKYSEIPTDDMLMEFEMLNNVSIAEGNNQTFQGNNLHRIIFHTSEVLVSLSVVEGMNDVYTHYQQQFAEGSVVLHEEDIIHRLNLSRVYAPIGQGRFVQTKYAILKNGYVVNQYRETEQVTKFVDTGEPRLIVSPNGEPIGLSFLTQMLPVEAMTAEGLAEYKITLKESLDTAIGNRERAVSAGGQAASDQEVSDLDEIEESRRAVFNTFNVLTGLIDAIVSATQGSITTQRIEAGTSVADEIVTTSEDGDTTHVILRQPVYFFLGSVLEALRRAIGNKVKFVYSRVPNAKDGEPFSINIPENTGSSIENTYAAEIESLTQQLVQLNGGPLERDDEGRIFIVNPEDNPDRGPTEAQQLAENQNLWDTALSTYIRGRGQDVATLGYNDAGRPSLHQEVSSEIQLYENQGVYHSYTTLDGTTHPIKPSSPKFGWNDAGGGNWKATHYEDGMDYLNGGWDNPNGYKNAILPWVYNLGGRETYYAQETARFGIATISGHWPQTNSDGRTQHWMPSDVGFLRLWRPEDLQAAIQTADLGMYNSTIIWRQPKGDVSDPKRSWNRGGYPSFYTDSFGQGDVGINSNPGMPDYGLQSAYKKNGRFAAGRDGSENRYSTATNYYYSPSVERKKVVVQRIMGWCNWIPVDKNSGRWDVLGGDIHLSYGNANQPNNSFQDPRGYFSGGQGTQENLKALEGWYKIKWKSKRPAFLISETDPGDTYEVEEEFWVRGRVVKDFVSMNGPRPTTEYPNPRTGEAQSETADRHREMQAIQDRIDDLKDLKKSADLTQIFKKLPIRSTFELPVNINTIKQYLTSEPRAPLHNLLKKVLASVKETVPNMQISMRPHPSDTSYIDVFPSALNYDGAIQEVFTEVEISGSSTDPNQININQAGDDIERLRKNNPQGLLISEKVMVCQFGMGHSLVENFGLSSKIDPTAFAAFRLPAVVGGAEMDVLAALRNTQLGNGEAFENLLGDFAQILKGGLTTGMEGLKKLKIVEEVDGGTFNVNTENLTDFLLTENVPAISKAAVGFVEDMMAQDVTVYNKILLMQNEYFMNKQRSEQGTTGSTHISGRNGGSKFYGNVLSTFLRTATLTIHGTTGLNVFNLIYLKGLLSGVEGLYLISSVNESIAASTFTTTLECKLIEYVNNSAKTNPLAYKGQSDLNRLATIIEEGKRKEEIEFGQHYNLVDLNTYITAIDESDGTLQD